MMQYLMVQAAHGQVPDAAAPRNVVTLGDALDAVLQLAAVIDSATQGGLIPREQGDHGAAMLMIIRDYIKPLPVGERGDGADGVGDDLAALVRDIRGAGGESGIQG